MSGISGFRPVETPEIASEGVEDTGAEISQEASIVRGGAPPISATIATMDASVLQARLEDTGVAAPEAAETAQEITEVAGDIEALRAELDDLYELEGWYEEWLADPDLDPWTASWIESDLWDVRFDIYDLEDQLGVLQGDLSQLMSGAWDALFGALETGLELTRLQGQQISDRGKVSELEAAFERTRKAMADRLSKVEGDRLEQLKEKGVIIPAPPRSEFARSIAKELSAKVDAAKLSRDADSLEAIRSIKKRIADPLRPGALRADEAAESNASAAAGAARSKADAAAGKVQRKA